jgi:hypothetical protein
LTFNPQTLQTSGLRYAGFGVLPKFPMLDRELPITSKALYALLCAYAGNDGAAFPSRAAILAELGICKDAFYEARQPLIEQGYITIERKRGRQFARNMYHLPDKPIKFLSEPADPRHAEIYAKIRKNGLKSAGYGVIPKSVMQDPRETAKAKAIYAYQCAFAGAGKRTNPRVSNILYHLKICEKTYYRHYGLLKSANYLTAAQRHENGRYSVNDYELNNFPNPSNAIKKAFRVIKAATSKASKPIKTGISAPLAAPSVPRIASEDITSLVHGLTRYDQNMEFYKRHPDKKGAFGCLNLFRQPKTPSKTLARSLFVTANEALADLCADRPKGERIRLKGREIDPAEVAERLRRLAAEVNEYGEPMLFEDIFRAGLAKFKAAAEQTAITHKLRYMQACLLEALLTLDLDTQCEIGALNAQIKARQERQGLPEWRNF